MAPTLDMPFGSRSTLTSEYGASYLTSVNTVGIPLYLQLLLVPVYLKTSLTTSAPSMEGGAAEAGLFPLLQLTRLDLRYS